MSDNEWQRVTNNDNLLQQVTVSDKTNEYEWEWVKKSDFMFQKEQKTNLVPE